MAALFPFEVHTPHRLFFNEPVEAVVLTLIDGEVAVYANHVPFTAPVVPCLLRIKDKKGSWRNAFAAEGILEVKENKAVLISEAVEWAGEIDPQRAEKAKKRAEEILRDGGMKIEMERAVSSLRRANMRMKIKGVEVSEAAANADGNAGGKD